MGDKDEDFLMRAWVRLNLVSNATLKAHQSGVPVTLSTAEVGALLLLADAAIGAVERDGCVPGSLCSAVVHYSRKEAP